MPVLLRTHGGEDGKMDPRTARAMNMRVLEERYAGIDRLFSTYMMGIVADPDFAKRKDPRIYQRMLRDPVIYSALLVRQLTTAALPWDVESVDESEEANQLALGYKQRLSQCRRLSETFQNMLEAILYGLSVIELMWKYTKIGYVVERTYPVMKDRFTFTVNGELRLKTPSYPIRGVSLPFGKFIPHTHDIQDASFDKPDDAGYCFYGMGLADRLYHIFYFKMTAIRMWLKFLERHGSPFKIAYVREGGTAYDSMKEILLALQNDTSIAIPGMKGEDVEIETSRSGGGGAMTFAGFVSDYCDELITRAILGQTMVTSVPKVGSYALGQVQESVLSRIVNFDKSGIEDTWNYYHVSYDMRFNVPNAPEELYPKLTFRYREPLDVEMYLRVADGVRSMGLPISEQDVREATGFRTPTKGEAIIAPIMPELMGEGPPETLAKEPDTKEEKDKQNEEVSKRMLNLQKVIRYALESQHPRVPVFR